MPSCYCWACTSSQFICLTGESSKQLPVQSCLGEAGMEYALSYRLGFCFHVLLRSAQESAQLPPGAPFLGCADTCTVHDVLQFVSFLSSGKLLPTRTMSFDAPSRMHLAALTLRGPHRVVPTTAEPMPIMMFIFPCHRRVRLQAFIREPRRAYCISCSHPGLGRCCATLHLLHNSIRDCQKRY